LVAFLTSLLTLRDFFIGVIIGDGLGANQGQSLDRNLAGAIDVKSLRHGGAMPTTVHGHDGYGSCHIRQNGCSNGLLRVTSTLPERV